MAYQTGKGVGVYYKVETTYNTAPTNTGAKVLRITASPGLTLKKAAVNSNEVRSDGQTAMARHGSKTVDGSYNFEFNVGGFDDILEAVMRSTWAVANAVNVTTFTSVTVASANTLTATAGSFITAGFRVGDVIRLNLTGGTASNNNKNLRLTAVAAGTLTWAETLTIDSARSAGTITIGKKLKNAATPTRRTFYIEEYGQDIDLSQVYGGCRFVGLKIAGAPDGMVTGEVSVIGASGTPLSTAASPFYSSPTLGTSIGLVFADATLRVNGVDIAVATSFNIEMKIQAKTESVNGSATSPDVFDNDMMVSGSLTLLRQDLANVTSFVNETEISLSILLVEPESEPKDYIHIFLPRLKFMDVTDSLGSDGAMVESIAFTCGKIEGVTGNDDTTMTITTSAP